MTKDDFTYDASARAAYLYLVADLPEGAVARTISITDAVNLDYDQNGTLIGIEFLYVDRDPRAGT